MNTLIDLFERSCRKFPENPYLWEKKNGKYISTSYTESRKRAKEIAAGLLGAGLRKGDRVALLSEGCKDWVCSELGMFYAGAVNVPLSIKLNPAELQFRINHSETRFLIVSRNSLKTIRTLEEQLPLLEKIFVLDETECNEKESKTVAFKTLIDTGYEWLDREKKKTEELTCELTAEDVANITYTSGTTAGPKGIMLTHGNYVCNVLQADSLIRIPEHYRVLLFLPWDHSFAHTVGIYSFMYNGASIASVDPGRSPMEYLRNIPVNMREIKPHILLSVPAIAKNFRKNIENSIGQKGKFQSALYRKGLKIAYIFYKQDTKNKAFRSLLYPIVKLFDGLVFSKIRRNFGGNLRYFIGGGALLDIELQLYFQAIGIPMYQGYGLSETSPVISSNTPRYHIFGSSGRPVKSIEVSICDENGREVPAGTKGEIVIKGGNVMKGYWKNPEETEAYIRGGRLYTGDLGYMGKNGYLYVLGRFKSLLISDDGEKYSPEGIEESIVEKLDYIDSCMLYNNQSPYTSALIVPNKSALRTMLLQKHIEPGSIEGYRVMLTEIYNALMSYRKGGKYEGLFPERWLPAVIGILPEPLSEQNGTINSTAKMVRHRIVEQFREELDYLYAPEGKQITNARNVQNLRKIWENMK